MAAQPDPISAHSLAQLFLLRVNRSGAQPALLLKQAGTFQAHTWAEIQADVFRTAALLKHCSVEVGDRVAQVSENRYEWILVDMAAQMVGAVHVALHPALSGKQLMQQLGDCAPRVLFVANQALWTKLQASGGDAPTCFGFEQVSSGPGAQPRLFSAALEAVNEGDQKEIGRLATSLSAEGHDRLATIIYTSGSTGQPRGAMLTSGNLAFNAQACVAAFAERPGDIRLNFLPLSHVFARTCDLYSWIVRGSLLALAEHRETIIADCQSVRPTLLNGVPYFFEKVRRGLAQQQKAHGPGVLRETLGGAIRLCTSGGAALADDTVNYYSSQQVTLVQGYGITETSPVISLSTESMNRRGAVGKPLPQVEVQFAADGEILTRGPHVMAGYWNDAAATSAAIQAGWFHTGDLGHCDSEGFLWITGRKKEMIVTANGKKIAPAALETALMLDPLIEQACIVGDGQPYLAALIVPNPHALREAIRRMRLWVFSRRGALRHRRVIALYRQVLQKRLADRAGHEQIGPFQLLPCGFTPENGQLTPKLSLRRSAIAEHWAAEIQALYGQSCPRSW